jgi:hypothetical protein
MLVFLIFTVSRGNGLLKKYHKGGNRFEMN